MTDLIFGLALSIGAVGLLNNRPADALDLLLNVSLFLFSFLILISIWLRYTDTMSTMSVETRGTRTLNILLLFFVAIEPYLFNLIGSSASVALLDITSTAYALDIGSVYAILASFNTILSSERRHLVELGQLPKYRVLRNMQLLVVALFWISILPQFYTIRLSIGGGEIPVRFLFWISTFAFPRGIAPWMLKRTGRLEPTGATEPKTSSST